MDWTTYKTAFTPDDLPRYICVPEVSLGDWNTYYRMLLKTSMGVRLLEDGEPVPLPERIDDSLFQSEHRYLFVLDMAGVKIFWRLETTDMMRFQVLPQSIESEVQATLVFRIMSTLGRRLGKAVFMIHPADGRVLFRYISGQEGVEYLG